MSRIRVSQRTLERWQDDEEASFEATGSVYPCGCEHVYWILGRMNSRLDVRTRAEARHLWESADTMADLADGKVNAHEPWWPSYRDALLRIRDEIARDWELEFKPVGLFGLLMVEQCESSVDKESERNQRVI